MPHLHWLGDWFKSWRSERARAEDLLVGEGGYEPLHLVMHLKETLFPQNHCRHCTDGLGH